MNNRKKRTAGFAALAVILAVLVVLVAGTRRMMDKTPETAQMQAPPQPEAGVSEVFAQSAPVSEDTGLDGTAPVNGDAGLSTVPAPNGGLSTVSAPAGGDTGLNAAPPAGETGQEAAPAPEEDGEPAGEDGEQTGFVRVPVFTPEPTATPLPDFSPVKSDVSDVIYRTDLLVHGESASSYQADAEHTIDFGGAEDYTQLPGIVTFRGNNFRNTSSYGTAVMEAGQFGDHWSVATGSLAGWAGSGWTGQPLVVQWPDQTRRNMDMYDWAKEKDGLIEVVYATLAGRVYFIDLETGEQTRDSLYLGYPFKGAGSLDPRGYPLMYLGGGVQGDGTPRILVVSLIDGEVLFETGNSDSFAPRGWSAWDSAPLVDAETDQLIYPGENGVLYLIDLNSSYDEAAGTISVDPEVIKFSYRSSKADRFYYGMEDSAIAWRHYLFIADNGASFLCIDLNTLEIVWRFDCLDDTNCTGVLEVDETGHPYIYMSTSFHNGWRSSTTAEIPVWKIDAVNGQEVWHHSYECHSITDLSGGVQGSISLGTGPLEGIVYVSVARFPDLNNGKLVALDADTGEELWTVSSDSYSWSTPVTFYDTDGYGYVLYASCVSGYLYLVNGKTGEVLDKYEFGCTVEATPVVYNNTVVIGTRGQEILGITLK